MLAYNPKKWFQFRQFFTKSDSLRQLLPFLILIFLFSIGVAYVEREILHIGKDHWLHNVSILHSILGFVISLLIVFRTNTAYDRWWEGRKLWGALVNCSRNLAIKMSALLKEEDLENRAFFRDMIALYAISLKDHLQLERTRLSLDYMEHPELEKVQDHQHIPNQIAQLIIQRIYLLRREGMIDGYELLTLNKDMTALTDICGGCERIRNTPIPYSYSSFLKRFLVVYLVTLPLGYVLPLGYYVAPMVTFILYVLGSLEVIAEEIEDPFGNDANDLPTTKLAENIAKHVGELLL